MVSTCRHERSQIFDDLEKAVVEGYRIVHVTFLQRIACKTIAVSKEHIKTFSYL